MAEKPLISVCICTYNRDEFLGKALESLANQTLNPEDYEILLIDNNSTDQTPQIAANFEHQYPNHRFSYIVEKKQGLSFARNRAIHEASGPIIAFIDDDAIAAEHYLETLVNFFDQNPEVDAGGGKILPYYYPEGSHPKWLSKYMLGLISCLDIGDEVKPFKRYPMGCNMAFRKSTFDRAGLFNTQLGRNKKNLAGSEEKEIFIRIKKAGMKVYYIPKASVQHIIPQERLHQDYIERLSRGIGSSERVILEQMGFGEKVQILSIQTIRTVATIIIALGYWLKGQFPKGTMMLKYRWWFTMGFFGIGVRN